MQKILSRINSLETVDFEAEKCSGSEAKSKLINNLLTTKYPCETLNFGIKCWSLSLFYLDCRWDAGMTASMTSLVEDVPLTTDELSRLTNKIKKMLKDSDIQDAPTLVYQLLSLSSKVRFIDKSLHCCLFIASYSFQGNKRQILGIICEFFSEKDANSGNLLNE